MSFRIALLLIVFLGVGAFYYFLTQRDAVEPQKTEVQTDKDFYMRSFEITLYKADDETAKHVVFGELMERAADGGEITVQNPRIDLNDAEHGKWELTSASATLDDHLEKGEMAGSVTLKRPQTPSSILQTEVMKLDLENKRVTTDEKVVIIQGDNHIQSAGMSADLSKNSITLSSRVKGVYYP